MKNGSDPFPVFRFLFPVFDFSIFRAAQEFLR